MQSHHISGPRAYGAGEDGVRFDDRGDFLEGLLAQLLADLREGLALAVTQSHTSLELSAKHTIFGHKVRIAYQQFLIHCPSDRRQQVLPVHRLSPAACIVHIGEEYGGEWCGRQAEVRAMVEA